MDRDTRRVGLFMGDHSANDANPHRSKRSSKWRPISTRLTIEARTHARKKDTSRATISAANPGRKLANLVRKRVVESTKACLTCPHIRTSDCCSRRLRVEPVRPAPAGDQMRFAGFVSE